MIYKSVHATATCSGTRVLAWRWRRPAAPRGTSSPCLTCWANRCPNRGEGGGESSNIDGSVEVMPAVNVEPRPLRADGVRFSGRRWRWSVWWSCRWSSSSDYLDSSSQIQILQLHSVVISAASLLNCRHSVLSVFFSFQPPSLFYLSFCLLYSVVFPLVMFHCLHYLTLLLWFNAS